MKITKIFSFDAAHTLHEHKGKCKNLHGHTYFLHITVEGSITPEGFVIDFGVLKEIMQPVIDQLDHRYLNDLVEKPTCENLLFWIRDEIKKTAPELKVAKIKLYETPTSYAEIEVN